jgi:hypothetical protein
MICKLSTTITLKRFDLNVKLSLDILMKMNKYVKEIRLKFSWIKQLKRENSSIKTQ